MKLNLKQEDFKFITIGFLPTLVLYVVYLLYLRIFILVDTFFNVLPLVYRVCQKNHIVIIGL